MALEISSRIIPNTAQNLAIGLRQSPGVEIVQDGGSIPLPRATHQCTLKNLAHLFGDAIAKNQQSEITGEHWEGNTLTNSLEFLSRLLSLCSHENPLLREAHATIENALPLFRALYACTLDRHCSYQQLSSFSKTIAEQIDALPPGKSMLLPSGWIGLEHRSHAMLVKVKKETEEEFSLFLINTGNGIERHDARASSLKTLINPVLLFSPVSKEQLLHTGFISALLMSRTFTPSHKGESCGKQDIYHLFFSRFPLKESTELDSIYITQQRSGTCSLRCALAYLHATLGTDVYKREKMTLDFIALREIDDLILTDSAFTRLIHHAIERTAFKLQTPTEERVHILEQLRARAISETTSRTSSPMNTEENRLLPQVVEALRATAYRPRLRAPGPPCVPIPLPDLRGKGWLDSCALLINFFEKNAKNPLDSRQIVAFHLTTQAILSLPLSIEFVSQEERWVLREKILLLAKKYATAGYLFKNVGLEERICINKLYALFWQLTLSLEGEKEGLKEFGVDFSHLCSITPAERSAGELEKLIRFFENHHPCPGNKERTLLAIGSWLRSSGSSDRINLPLNANHGEAAFFEEHYLNLSEGNWEETDRSRHHISPLITQKEWRLAHLFVQSPTKGYHALREMALIAWLFAKVPQDKPIQFTEINWDPSEGKLYTQLFCFSGRDLIVVEPHLFSSKNPWTIGSTSDFFQRSIKGEMAQNEYLVNMPREFHPLFDIGAGGPLSFSRLISYFRENILLFKEKNYQTFFQQVLFRCHLVPDEVLHLTEYALYALQASSTKQELLQTTIFLYSIQLAVLPPDQKSKKEQIRAEIEELLKEPSHLSGDLHLLWILTLSVDSWLEKELCLQAVLHFLKAQTFPQQNSQLRVYPILYTHIENLREAFADPILLRRAVQSILHFDEMGDVMGVFPQVAVRAGGHLYELHLLSGTLLCNQTPLKDPRQLLEHPTYREFSRGRSIEELSFISIDRYRAICDGKLCEFTLSLEKGKWELTIESGELLYLPAPLKKIPLGNPLDFQYWVPSCPSPMAGLIENIREKRTEVTLFTDATALRHSREGIWRLSPPEHSPLFSIMPKEQIAFWEGNTEEIICYGLQTPEGEPLVFQNREASFLPGFFLTSEMWIKEVPHVILKNRKGASRALIPIKTHGGARFEVIPLNSKGRAKTNIPAQNLLLAHYFLGAKQYEEALGFLKNAESASVYSPEELQLLGWITHHFEQTKDHSPKALSISLIAAHMAQENLRRFPEAYSERYPQDAEADFQSAPLSVAAFWKGVATWKSGEGKKKTLPQHLAQLLTLYYNVSAHCKGQFQLHEGVLTPFEEAQWLREIIHHYPMRELIHRLNFLSTGQVSSQILRPPPYTFPTPPFPEPGNQEWIRFVRSLANFRRHGENRRPIEILPVRPGEELYLSFGNLYLIATEGSEAEKTQLRQFLEDMTFDPDCTHQLIRSTLLSQLPPYDISPESQEIAKVIRLIEEDMRKPCPIYKPSAYQSSLLHSLQKWHTRFFPPCSVPREILPPIVEQSVSLLPPLPTERKEKIRLHTLEKSEPLIILLNTTGERYFAPAKKTCGQTRLHDLPEHLRQNPFFEMRANALRRDLAEGIALNQSQERYVLRPEEEGIDLSEIRKSFREVLEDGKRELKVLQKEIKQHIHSVSGGRERQLEAQLKRLAKTEIPPKFNECIALFVQGDLALYQKRIPFLSAEDCVILHEKIGQYLQLATTLQRIGRVDKLLDPLKFPLLAEELMKKREYDPKAHPELMVFEYYSNLSLRKEQCDRLIQMTTLDPEGKFPSLLLQMIMNSGKTTVLGTLLALMKADGYHLSMLFLPPSLLRTNAAEMKERGEKFFGQRGHVITFGRGSNYFNLNNLSRLHHLLRRAIVNREYILLTAETKQSMQNQLTEARERICAHKKSGQFPDQIRIMCACASELKKILHLIRVRGAATFDEIDAQFDPGRQFNSPGIYVQRLDPHQIELIGEIYKIASTDTDIKQLGLNLHANTQALLLPRQIEQVKQLLIEKVLSAIYPKNIEELKQYFQSPGLDPPNVPHALLLKREIHSYLPASWKSSAYEHYSRSRKHPEYLAAKPNITANTPNENAEIAHAWELVNKTLQLYVCDGVDAKQAAVIVQTLQKVALLQWRSMGPGAEIETTPAAQMFYRATQGRYTLFKANCEDPQMLNTGTSEGIHLIIQYLVKEVFPHLKIHMDQIHNIAMNLSYSFSSLQGYSGSANNPYKLPHVFLQKDGARILLDRGANGRVIDFMCQYNRSLNILPASLKSPEEIMNAAHRRYPVEKRNLFTSYIDIGADFKGRTNAQIAHSFLRYFSDLPNSPIEAVLYYDDDTNALFCIRKTNPETPLFIPTTDAKTIAAITSLKPFQRFTYYDKYHSRGSNIVQEGMAFYTLGDQTTLEEHLQGVMRKRDLLEEKENLEAIVRDHLLPVIFERTRRETIDIETLYLFYEINTLEKEQTDNVRTLPLKLESYLRGAIQDKMYTLEIEEEEPIHTAARPLFMRKTLGEIHISSQRGNFLIDQVKEISAKLQQISNHLEPEPLLALCTEIKEIAVSSLPYLPLQVDLRALSESTTIETVSTMECRNDLEIEAQKITSGSSSALPAVEKRWASETLYGKIPYKSIKSSCFSQEFHLSDNYLQTAHNEYNLMGPLQKYPHEALLLYDKANVPHLVVLSSQEAKDIFALLQDKPANLTLVNQEGKVAAGCPYNREDSRVEQLLVQFLFFGGRLSLLREAQWKRGVSLYLETNRALKRQFLENTFLTRAQFKEYQRRSPAEFQEELQDIFV